MIEVSNNWVTTPVVCDVCGHKMQFVFQTNIIKDGDRESWKLPDDITCSKCGSDKITFTDFENEQE